MVKTYRKMGHIQYLTQLIFGLCPDVKDADELLEMIESNTANPDHISLN